MIPQLKSLFDHMAWADERAPASLRGAPDNERALMLYSHILGAERVWLSRMAGEEPRLAVWPALTADEAAELAAANAAGFRAVLAAVPPDFPGVSQSTLMILSAAPE